MFKYQEISTKLVSGSQVILHRIVAYTFLVGLPESLSDTLDHINKNPLDNRAVNLRWAVIPKKAT